MISIVIPCWSMNGVGKEVLEFSFKILEKQSMKGFEVVITDHSEDNNIENLCKNYKNLNIKYIKNLFCRGSGSNNINLALRNCFGEYIKILCQDDFLLNETSLETCYKDIVSSGKVWGFNSYVHSQDRQNYYNRHVPKFNQNIETVNTLGTPSALIMKNKLNVFMDEYLKFCYDCEFYKRLYLKYGSPNISENDTMVNYIHPNQTTNTIANDELRIHEENYIRRKFFC